MSNSEETKAPGTDLVTRRTNPFALDTNLAPVDWKELRERFDPQGTKTDARELVDRTFTIVEYRAIESSYEGSDVFYYVKALDPETGELFNTSLGGQAVVEVLNAFDALRSAHREAVQFGDTERAQELEDLGAVRPIVVTLRWVAQGKYGGYYCFD